jgi:hypothetical protein
MWLETSETTVAWVSWRPPQTTLHYAELYRGIWEFLRMPPRRELEPRAKEYLRKLHEWPYGLLQRDRVAWVEAWLAALPMEERRKEVLGGTTYRMLEVVCYEPPPMRGSWREVGRLRAG